LKISKNGGICDMPSHIYCIKLLSETGQDYATLPDQILTFLTISLNTR